MSSFGDPEDFQCMIEEVGNTVEVEAIESSTYNKYGDATDVTGTYVKVKAMTQYLTFEDRMVQEGQFNSGDIIFWFGADDVNKCALDYRNKIILNLLTYEIMEIIPHQYDDLLFMYEVRAKRV